MDELKNIGLFSLLDDEELKTLKSISKIQHYKKEQILFFEGEEAKNLLIVLSGKVAVYKVKDSGDETVLGIFNEGDLFAEAPCINSFLYPASAKCLQESKILEINFEEFKNQFLIYPEICLKIILGLSQKIKKLSNFISNSNKTATQKLAEYMLYYDINKIKKKDLAAKLNIRPETLSRIMAKFTQEKL